MITIPNMRVNGCGGTTNFISFPHYQIRLLISAGGALEVGSADRVPSSWPKC